MPDDEKRESAVSKVLREARTHKSDCAIYNEPALPSGECDCGAAKRGAVPSPDPAEGFPFVVTCACGARTGFPSATAWRFTCRDCGELVEGDVSPEADGDR